MLKEEFEKLTGKQVSWETYQKWNDLYMDSDLDKFQFCKSVKKCVKEKEPETMYVWGTSQWGNATCYHLFEVVSRKIDISTGSEVFKIQEVGKTIDWGNPKEMRGFDYNDYVHGKKIYYYTWKATGKVCIITC